MSAAMISVSELRMTYVTGVSHVDALVGVDLDIAPGEKVAVTGPSGCGKTTLLLLMAGLEQPTGGRIVVDGATLGDLDSDGLADLRRDKIGIVFQAFHLVPSLSALDNVALPLEIAGRGDAQRRAREMLERVGLGKRERHHPSQLSGGEQQRVAIARALVHRPAVILADEPTGNLDDQTGSRVAKVLFDLVDQTGATLVLVTHDAEMANRCDRVLRLHDGALESYDGSSERVRGPVRR